MDRRILHRTALLVPLLGAMSAAAQPGPVPTRIVSIVPAVTEMLFAIGAGPQVVGVGSYDRYPAEVEGLPRVGALLDPDLEQILALRPDLAVVFASQEDLRQQLARAHVPLFVFAHDGRLDDVTRTIRELGERVGRSGDAGAVASAMEARLAAIRARVAGRPRPRVLMVFGRDEGSLRNLYVNGGLGIWHDMLIAAGGDNVFADVLQLNLQPPSEVLLQRAPDVILEIRAGGATPSGTVDIGPWQRLGAIPAVRERRIHVAIGDELVVPGPRIVDGVERIARLLHPEAFR